jgi:hypothetical protein
VCRPANTDHRPVEALPRVSWLLSMYLWWSNYPDGSLLLFLNSNIAFEREIFDFTSAHRSHSTQEVHLPGSAIPMVNVGEKSAKALEKDATKCKDEEDGQSAESEASINIDREQHLDSNNLSLPPSSAVDTSSIEMSPYGLEWDSDSEPLHASSH